MKQENKLQGIRLIATGRALPARVVTNDELSRTVDTSDEWIRTRTGIRQRYICGSESCQSLAVKAARNAVSKAGIKTDEIGMIVVATTTSDYAFPSMACMVQKELDMENDVMCFDINAACSGFLYGLNICRSLLMSQNKTEKKYALLIGSEQMSRLTDFTDRATCVLFGDGAGAAVLELGGGLFFHRAWSKGDAEILFCQGSGFSDAHIRMEGNKVFKFAVNVIKDGIDTILSDAGLTIDDIDYVVCHQANERIIEHVRKKYGCADNKFYVNIGEYANTSAASIPIALDEMAQNNLLKKGMKIICVGFGAGLTWSSALFEL